MKPLIACIFLFSLFMACTGNGKNKHIKALEKEWKKHLQPQDSIVNVMRVGQTFALESHEVQGIDRERFKEFDYWKEWDEGFFEPLGSKSFSNPDEAGGLKFTLEIFKAIRKGETEIRFYKKRWYGNLSPEDALAAKDTTVYLYNTYRFRIE